MRDFFVYQFIFCSFLVLSACGVKGDPEAPVPPEELGRGRPAFSQATENVILPSHPSYTSEDDEDWPDDSSDFDSSVRKRQK